MLKRVGIVDLRGTKNPGVAFGAPLDEHVDVRFSLQRKSWLQYSMLPKAISTDVATGRRLFGLRAFVSEYCH
jgi:hypothetical protein